MCENLMKYPLFHCLIGSLYGILACICLIFVVNVGKYTVPYMDPMGCAFIFTLGFTSLNCQHKTFWGCFGPLNDLSWVCEKRKAGTLPPNKKKTSSPNWISASGENATNTQLGNANQNWIPLGIPCESKELVLDSMVRMINIMIKSSKQT